LSDRGWEVFRKADVPPESALAIRVEEEDDRGVWVQIERHGAKYFLLDRWEYILSVEMPIGAARKEARSSCRSEHARDHHAAVQRMQEPELHHYEEPKKAFRPLGDAKVLQYMPQAHIA
jgi:hypothetical protein